MCNHTNAQITLRHSVDRTFDADGEQAGADVLLPDGRVSYHCPDCGAAGHGTTNDAPRWVTERVAALPVVR